LYVAQAFVDGGPVLKRFRARSMGRANPIKKRTSHITITVAPTN
jgi:large subunit ribosomal protein L22